MRRRYQVLNITLIVSEGVVGLVDCMCE